jgi:Protein of unknown function (DUF4238)
MKSCIKNAKNQHYVWRHYLDAWAAGGTFCCYRQADGKLFLTKPKAVGSQTYFYEYHELTKGDLAFLQAFIGRATDERLRQLHWKYVGQTQVPFRIKRWLADGVSLPDARNELKQQLEWAARNLGELEHTYLEGDAFPILKSLQEQDASFYHDVASCTTFLHFLTQQYFRTAKMKKGQSEVPPIDEGHDPRRTAGILNRIVAVNLAAALFLERHAYRIVFLRNLTEAPLVTADQPVINLLPLTTNDVELYYPLSPCLALLLTKDLTKHTDEGRSLARFDVERLNHAIYARSDDQLYGDNPVYLRALVSASKSAIDW